MADTITLKNPEETLELGRQWAARCRGGEILALHGTLGAGKTQLVKGLAQGLGYAGDVTSPTFTLIHEYTGGRLPLYHIDLYRLEDRASVERLGLDEYFAGGGVTALEWPERAAGLLPERTTHVYLEVSGQETRTARRENGS
jgi:tRNA threonylcarbamoyladenosine biosynthesis protein TsaE